MILTLKQRPIEYYDGDEKLIGQFIYNENQTTPQPTIIIYPAFEGVGAFAIEYGQRLAEQGYACFIVAIFSSTLQKLKQC